MKITQISLIIAIIVLSVIYFSIKEEKPVKKLIPADFPLKYGSKGESVKLLQQALLKKGYKLPKYGADGVWGNETQTAVVNAGLNNSISYAEFTNFIKI